MGLLETIQANLLAAKPAGSVPLDKTTLTAAGRPVLDLFQEHLGAPAVTFKGDAGVALAGGVLTVTGTGAGAPVLGLAAPSLTATLTLAGGAGALQIALTIAGTGWTLQATFPQLAATTPLGALTFGTTPTFTLRSTDGAADKYGLLAPAGLSLATTITVADAPPFSTLKPVYALPGTALPFAGSVTATPGPEAMSLRTGPGTTATAPLAVSGVGTFTLAQAAIALSAVATEGADKLWAGSAAAEVWGTASAGGRETVFAISPPPGAAAWLLGVVPGLSVPLTQLLGVVPGLSVIPALPEGVQQVIDGEVTAFSFMLSVRGTSATPVGLEIAVQTTTPWTILQGVLELERLQLALELTWENGPKLLGGAVGGALMLGDVEVDVSVPLPADRGEILVWSSPDAPLPGLGALAGLLGGADLAAALPPGVATLGGLRLTSLSATVGLSPPALPQVGLGLATGPWKILPGLTLDGVVLDVTVANPLTAPAVTGSISGTASFGTGPHPATLTVAVQRWTADGDWLLAADVRDLELPSLSDFATLAGADPTSLLPASLAGQDDMKFTLVDLGIEADLTAGTLDLFHVQVAMKPWDVAPGYFKIEQLGGSLVIDWRSGAAVYSGELTATLAFGAGAAQLVLQGERATDGSWTLSGRLTDDVDLIELVQKALGLTPSATDFGSLVVSPVALTYRSGAGAVGASYTFDAAARWTPMLEAVSFQLDASVHLERSPEAKYSGAIMGSLGAHFGTHALELSVGYLFQQQDGATSYVFGLRFDQLTLTGTYSKRANADEVVTVRLGGVTFGGIVTYLVDLADPDAHFSLSPPWDVLNKIRFDDLSLVVNLTQRSVGITYKVGQDLGLIDIDTIGLTYVRSGGSPGVKLEITGSFLGQKYTPDQPLGWDLLKDAPPTPSGQGTQAFELRLLGIGQHLVLVDPHADTMAKVIDELSAVVQKTKDKKQPWELLKFDAGAGWLLAADFTLMETLRLRLVFDDPVLYGVQITLAGEKAGIFAGLDFEILYRKLSDSLGVYHIALKLPDAMRHLELGEVSITLPNVVVDIYTDGSFYLDLGFPYNNDWTVCFGLQVFPFVGAGGFYFGKLSTAAAAGTDLVPHITNGTFGPVIEFGVALQVGVGKTISEGPLRAGLSLTVQGVVTGVVSWFNPTDASLGSAQYYRIQGTVAVVGQLYGSVDFKIISIDISIVATASVTLTVESYQPILVGLSLDVSVHASIKIIFFTIHFSFGLHLDASFTIGSAQATPWALAAPGADAGRKASLVARRRAETSHHAHAAARALLVAAVPERAPLQWKAVDVLGGRVAIAVELMPFLTPAVVDGAPAAVQVVLVPFVQTSVPAGAGHDEWRAAVASDPTTTADDMAFNQIARALVKWGMQTLIGTHVGDVTAVDLHLIYDDLCAADVAERKAGFGYGNVAAFLGANLTLTLAGPPAKADAVARAVLPMPPPLQMAPPAPLAPVSFWEAPEVDATWRENLQTLFDELKVNADYSRAPDPLADDADDDALVADDDAAPAEEPITEALFADWFLMVARSIFQSARNLLARHEHAPTDKDSLLGLARIFAPAVDYTVQQDDTAASIADLFAITTAQLVARNPKVPITPGQKLVVPAPVAEVEHVTTPGETLDTLAADWHVTTDAIRDANPDVGFAPLAAGTALRIPVPEAIVTIADANLDAPLAAGPLTIGGLTHQVRTGETLGAIATAAHAPDAGALGEANAAAPGILLTGATLQIAAAGTAPASIPYMSQAGDTLTTLAAMLLVRDLGSVEHAFGADASYAWLAGAIPALDANAGVVFSPLAAGVALEIPNVALGDKGLQPNGPPLAYTTKPGDTLALVAATFVMAELRAADAGLVATEAAIRAANPSVDWSVPLPPKTTLQLPGRAHAIVAGDSLGVLADRFWLTPRDLATVNATAPILAPTATLRLPAVSVPAAGLTLATLAAQLGVGAEALVGALGTRAGLFATGQKIKPLSIPEVRRLEVDALCRLLVSSGEANSAAGQASSFFLQGLQVPVPKQTGQNAPLFALTGQQFPGPSAPQDTTITFTAPKGEPWLSLAGGTVAVTLTQSQMQTDWPSTTLDPQVAPGYPKAVPLGRSEAVRHRVAPPIPWAVPTLPALSGAAPPPGGGPQLFALPASLLARVAADPVAHPYDLMTAAKGSQDAPVEVPTYAWATWVPFTVRRVPGPGGTTVANAYVTLGADQAGADALLALWTWLQEQDAGVTLSLGHADASGTGVVSEALDPARVALVKANLSTETHSPRAMREALAAGAPAPPAAATLADGWPFAQLLWEATITGSGGFYLNYETTGGGPLPDAVFAGGEEATLMLVAVLDEQATAGGGGYRTLHPFTTGALVEGNLDPGRYDVFAAAADGSDTTTVATAPPGNVAFALQRTNPSPAGGADPSAEDRTRALYSMLSLTLGGTGFGTPELVLPTGPKSDDVPTAWRYDRTVPVYKQATPRPAPLPDALPDAATDDPYAGIAAGAAVTIDLRLRDRFGNDLGDDAGTVGPIAVGYYDPVIGVSGWPGATAAYIIDGSDGAAALALVVDLGLDRYVPSPSNLFAAAVRGAAADRTTYGQAFFQLRRPDVTCSVTTSLDPGGHACLDSAAVKAPLLAFVTGAYVYLGMAQALEPAELTVPAAGGPTTLRDLAEDLFVTPGQLAAANAAADASQLFAGPIAIPALHVVRAGDTPASIAGGAALSVDALLKANTTVALNAGAVLQTAVRTYTPAGGDTLTAIAALEDATPAELAIANSATPGLLAPWSGTIGAYTLKITAADTFATLVAPLAAQDATITTPADVGRALANLPGIFVPGTPIAIAGAPVDPHDATGARTVTTVAGQTPAEVAKAAGCSVAGLALANGQTPGVLIPGTSVDVEGVVVAVPPAGSFVALVDALRAQDLVVGIADVARALAGVAPLLAGGVVLAVVDHVVAAEETLATSAVLTPAILELLDASASDVYAIGTPLVVATERYGPQPGDTLAALAGENALTVDQLATANALTTLAPGAPLAHPGGVQVGTTGQAPCQIPFDAATPPTLTAIARTFGTDAGALGTLNADMPGLFVPDVTIAYPGHPVTTSSTSTPASLAAAAGAPDVNTFMSNTAVADAAGLVAAGALFVAPLPPLTGALDHFADLVGVATLDLASANAALVGLVEPQHALTVTVAEAEPPATVVVTSGTHDTLATLLRRVQATAPEAQLADVVAACVTDPAALVAGTPLVVPPAPVTLTGPLAQPVAPAAPMTPLEVTITVARDPALRDPAFADAPDVAANATAVSPELGHPPTLAGFATAFEAAFATRRLKLATGPQPAGSAPRLWVADFGPAGIGRVTVDGDGARFHAVAPMRRTLAGGAVPIKSYTPSTGKLGAPATQTFASADLDGWMRAALTAIDLVLSPAVAAAAWRLDPAGVDAIVASKGAIAKLLSERVQSILQTSDDPGADAAAQDALYQGMLVSLASAYATDAVITYPVTVTSPFSGPLAPRLSGKAVARQYQVAPGAGVAEAAAWYGVSVEAMAAAIADAQVLDAGAPGHPVTATFGGREVAIAPADTLTTLAAALGAPSVLALLAGVVLAPAGAGLLRPGAQLGLGRASTTPGATDSFTTVAAYFEQQPAALAIANQDRPGVLATQTLSFGGRTHPVVPTDTIAIVAQALALTPATLATAPGLGDAPGIFAPTPLHALQVLPDLSLSTAKAPLADGTNHVAFLFGTGSDASFKSLFLDVDYDVSEIEFAIEDVPQAGDYRSSDWLRLVIPLGSSAFGGAVDLAPGQTQVPIPLRAFPLLPSVVDLTEQAAVPRPATIAEAKEWELAATIQHQSAAQDTLQLEVAFGAVPTEVDAGGPDPLLAPLAQFVAAWRDVQNDVAALAALPATAVSPPPKLVALVGSLATLAGDLAAGLAASARAFGRATTGGQLYYFALEPTIDHTGPTPVIDFFDLGVLPGSDAHDVPWPTVHLGDPSQPLQRTVLPDGRRRYMYASPRPPAFSSLTQTYIFPGDAPGRDAVVYETGQTAVAAQRNADLVTTAATADAFLYQTPWVTFSSPAVPYLVAPDPIPAPAGADLQTAVTAALTALLSSDGLPIDGHHRIRLLCTHERLLAGTDTDDGAVRMGQPVVYLPQRLVTLADAPTIATEIATRAATWAATIQPHPLDAYILDLSIFATADLAMTRPLVAIPRIVVPVTGLGAGGGHQEGASVG